MKKINWGLLIALLALIIFWFFAIWVIGNIIVLKEEARNYESEEQFLDILKQKKQQLHIAAFKETYYCPDPNKDFICRKIAKLSDKYNIDKQLMIDLAWCESKLDPYAVGKKDNDDLGLFQINSRYHDVSDRCRMDIECSTLWTINKIKEGKIGLWNCYKLIR